MTYWGILSWTRCKRAKLFREGRLTALAELDQEIVSSTKCPECLAIAGFQCHAPDQPQKICEPHLARQKSHDNVKGKTSDAD